MKQVKLPLKMEFKSYEEAQQQFDQDLAIYDFEKMAR